MGTRFQAEEFELYLASSVQPLKVFGSCYEPSWTLGRLAWKLLNGEIEQAKLKGHPYTCPPIPPSVHTSVHLPNVCPPSSNICQTRVMLQSLGKDGEDPVPHLPDPSPGLPEPRGIERSTLKKSGSRSTLPEVTSETELLDRQGFPTGFQPSY